MLVNGVISHHPSVLFQMLQSKGSDQGAKKRVKKKNKAKTEEDETSPTTEDT